MIIKTRNILAQFAKVGQSMDFKIERDVIGKCKIFSINKETNEIELEVESDVYYKYEDFLSASSDLRSFEIIQK